MITLYFSFLTIFASWYIYDLRRLHERKGDCCGLCCCKEDTVLCCKGYFLSKRQKRFSADTEGGNGTDTSDPYASTIEKLFARFIAPCMVSNIGRICVISLWCVAILVAYNGVRELKSDFSIEFFIPKGSMTQRYVNLYN